MGKENVRVLTLTCKSIFKLHHEKALIHLKQHRGIIWGRMLYENEEYSWSQSILDLIGHVKSIKNILSAFTVVNVRGRMIFFKFLLAMLIQNFSVLIVT